MNTSARQLLVNAALLLATLMVSFGACELAVRQLYRDQTVLFPRYHTDYRYGDYVLRGIRPSTEFRHTSVDGSWSFTTNSRGFRNRDEYEYAKPPGTLRILSLGDSHTQGYEVRQEATFSGVLERFLRHRGIRAEVLNTGVSGFSTAEALVFLENEGHRYEPDAVALGFYANDFADNLKAGLFDLDARGSLTVRKHEHIPGVHLQNAMYALPPVRWLSENSYFYSMLFNGVWNAFKARLAAEALQDEQGIDPVRARAMPEYAVATAADVTPKQLALAAALLERMQRFCSDRGIRLIVIDIPARTGPFRFASSIPPELSAAMQTAGIEVLQSASVLDALDGAAQVHVPHGHHHISETTHALIARAIGTQLLARPRVR